MLELLAAIQSADPPSMVLWGIVWVAAMMYPVGLMLGADCSACCACSACEVGKLPPTLTVTLDGLEDQTEGPDLIYLSFSSCFGGGAAGRVTAPGGDPATAAGPISGVALTASGNGYAKLGRAAPTLTISGGTGTGATFTPSLSKSQDACGLDRWALQSVSFKGGSGYVDGDELTISIASGDTQEEAAAAVIRTERAEPTLEVAGNATTTIAYTDNDGTWAIESITVTDGGTGYIDGEYLTITLGTDDEEESAALLVGITGRIEPTVSVEPNGPAGSGAALAVTLTKTTDAGGRDVWAVASATVTTAGTGYSVGDPLLAVATDGQPFGIGYTVGEVTAVDSNGGITGVSASGGEFWKSDGILQDVDVSWGGSYYKDTGNPVGVDVTAGGLYYREDDSLPAYVAAVSVSISQSMPSDGTGGEITATIDDDPQSETFGQITGLSITGGGDGYLAWQWLNTKCCGDYYNGMEVVVRRNNSGLGIYNPSEPCRYMHRFCGVGNVGINLGYLLVDYYGPNVPPEIRLVSEDRRDRSGTVSSDTIVSGTCDTVFSTTQLVQDCDTWLDVDGQPVTFTAASGATATLAIGGEYDPAFRDAGGLSCHICCKGEELPPEEISATIADPRPTKQLDLSGVYVLALYPRWSPPLGLRWSSLTVCPNPAFPNECVRIDIELEPCSGQSTGFEPDGHGCDDCHYKCRVIAVATMRMVNGNWVYGWNSSDGADMCGICQATPICSVAGRSWSIPNAGEGGTISIST